MLHMIFNSRYYYELLWQQTINSSSTYEDKPPTPTTAQSSASYDPATARRPPSPNYDLLRVELKSPESEGIQNNFYFLYDFYFILF